MVTPASAEVKNSPVILGDIVGMYGSRVADKISGAVSRPARLAQYPGEKKPEILRELSVAVPNHSCRFESSIPARRIRSTKPPGAQNSLMPLPSIAAGTAQSIII